MEWNHLYTSGVYTDTLQTVSGCDSVLIIDLTINNSYVGDTVLTTSCDSLEWNGTVYDTSGIYTDFFTDNIGCDSIVFIDLTINSRYVGDTSVLASCDSLEWNGSVYVVVEFIRIFYKRLVVVIAY